MSHTTIPPRRKPRFRERHAVERDSGASVAVAPPPPAPPPEAAPAARRPVRLPRVHVTLEAALYTAIAALALLLRLWDLGLRAMHQDEAVHAWFSWNLFAGAGYQYDPVYHGPLQFPVTALFFFLFGDSETTGRLLAALCGTALVVTPYFLRRELGRSAALIAAFLIAISPEFVYDSRLERDDPIVILMTMVAAIAIWRFAATHRIRYVYIGAAALALSLSAMENTYITLFVLGGFVLLVLAGERAARNRLLLDRIGDWTGPREEMRWQVAVASGVLLLLTLIVTIATGSAIPALASIAVLLIGLVVRQAICEGAESDRPFLSALASTNREQWLNVAVLVAGILVVFYSTFGTNLRGIWDASQPLLNANGVCPGNPFPLNPCRKDIIGGLFYWLSQHRVARGRQPWFYYSFLSGLYEQIAVVFGLAGVVITLRRPSLFRVFLVYWAVVSFGVYSWAGEKFPWLLIHPLLPFTLLAAMVIAQIARPAGWRRLLLALVGLLALLELHSTYEVNFVNGADPVEMMVYVQSSPDTPRIAHDIESISNKVTNGNGLRVTIDTLETWPFAWYLRHMPNVAYPSTPSLDSPPYSTNPVILVDAADQPALLPHLRSGYTGKEYVLRWWFPEDYKTLTWSTFGRDAIDPGYWRVVWDWLIERRPFGPRGEVQFWYYVKKGLASPF